MKGIVLSLEAARVSLRLPTCMASIFAEMVGGRVIASRPGLVVVTLPDCGVVAEIRIRVVNVYDEDARVRTELSVTPRPHNHGTRGQE